MYADEQEHAADLSKMDRLSVPLADDFHIHLRQGTMMQLVTQQLKSSGIRLAYVMVLSHHKLTRCSPIPNRPLQRLNKHYLIVLNYRPFVQKFSFS